MVEDDDEVTLSEEFAINNPDHESVIKIKQEKKTPSKKSPVKKTPVKIKQESAATPTKRNLAGKRLTTSKKAKK